MSTPFASSVLTIGNFDGLHLGHRALIERVVARAKAARVPAVVMTFEPHPVKVLYPHRKLNRIFDLDDQREQLQAMGVSALVIEPFSREFSQLTPERYLQEWIYRPFGPKSLVVGYDFSFGMGRQGSIDLLRERAKEMGFEVEVVAPVKVPWAAENETSEILVSSTRIRQALESGEVALARALLGRPFYLQGIVEKGAGRGRTIGVPTANLRTAAETLPLGGVYVAWVWARERRWKSVVNVGMNPTFQASDSGQSLSIEAHLIDFPSAGGEPEAAAGNIYGEKIKIEFVDRVRSEKKFAGVTELVAQIRLDIEAGSRRLDGE